ncbi:MAG TPA: CHRD domain-containing protein [Rubricoccaceae bacterium]|jgi:hypothetical protein
MRAVFRSALCFTITTLAAAAGAQTTDFVGVISDEVPPAPVSQGVFHVRLTDNSAPNTDVVVVRGQFRGLASPYAASRIRSTATGALLQALAPGVAADGRSGGWGADLNTFTVSDAVSAAIQGGTATVEVTTDAQPAGAVRGRPRPLGVTVDGLVTESAYVTLATKQNANAGFGPAIDVASVRVFLGDPAQQFAVVAVAGRLNTGSNDGIGLLLGAQGTGTPAGTALGGTPGAGHFLGATEHPGFKADFPVALALALNPGGGTQSVFVDAVAFPGTPSARAGYLGAAAQDGGVAVGPPDQTAGTGPVADVLFAFRNDGATGSGFEIVLPRSALGFPVPVSLAATPGRITASAFVVSATAFFSDVTVPGNVTGGNLGFDPNFGTLAGGPFSATGGGFTALSEAPRGASVLRLAGPNPAGMRTRLVLTLAAAQPVRVDLLDALGRTVAVLHDGPAAAGETEIGVDVSALPAGVYGVRVAGASVRAAQRLTVAR